MIIPTDLKKGDIFHIINHPPLVPSVLIFDRYVKDREGNMWASTLWYSFLLSNGIAEPSTVEVARIERMS